MAIKDLTNVRLHLFLCNGGTCTQKGAAASTAAIRQTIAELGFADQVHTSKTLCNGRCNEGPVVIACPANHWYGHITAEIAPLLVRSLLLHHQPLPGHLFFQYPGNELEIKN